MKSNESSEMYLETILVLSKRLPVVRSVDVANELGFKKSSVSIAMKHLRENNEITVTDVGFISEDVATEDACRIEHVISQETIDAIKKHMHK